MSERERVGGVRAVARAAVRAGRRVPAVLLLFALIALVAGVCHGAHGHALALNGLAGESVSAPASSHGCEMPGEKGSFDAHLPAQSGGSQLSAPDFGGAVLVPYDEVFPESPHTRCVHGRAGPGPESRRLLIALGVNRN
ncbi:hypothetical protein ABZ990_26515 [Streptomyces sp. NPDC046203]|uniref:hypothetical protein n=1 Tax=Streptomyces sp. NPDC046203 TaxID=3154602 RepID=UPI003405AB05